MTTAILIILLTALAAYAVLGGADFGAGVWEFNTAFQADERDRNLLTKAIGPVWETNHVWLIFVLVLLFGAFPPAFASMNEALFVPLLLGLVGIVFRGAAYAFRSPLKSDRARSGHVWVVVFGLASVMAPFFLGTAIGALASGEMAFSDQKRFEGDYIWGWMNPLSIWCGLMTVGMCAYSAAVYMIRESRMAQETELESLWRIRALTVGTIAGVLALAGLLLVNQQYDELWSGIVGRGWPAVGLSLVAGTLSLVWIVKRRPNLAALGASMTCATVVVGWGLAQYPFLIPNAWHIEEAASPDSVLKLILIATGVGSIFLIPALILLFQIFKAEK